MNVLNLSLGDLSDEENIKTAQYELGRLPPADWAAKWGEALIARCFETAGDNSDRADDLAQMEITERAVRPLMDFGRDDAQRAACYLEFDRIQPEGRLRALGLWAAKWGRPLTQLLRPIAAPSISGAN